MGAAQQANSHHPGMPTGMAEIAEGLWRRHIRHDLDTGCRPKRDRFALAYSHDLVRLNAPLHLTCHRASIGYLTGFRRFRTKNSRQPEVVCTRSAETTACPLGQGVADGSLREVDLPETCSLATAQGWAGEPPGYRPTGQNRDRSCSPPDRKFTGLSRPARNLSRAGSRCPSPHRPAVAFSNTRTPEPNACRHATRSLAMGTRGAFSGASMLDSTVPSPVSIDCKSRHLPAGCLTFSVSR